MEPGAVRRKVLLTGAAGTIGGKLRDYLADHYDLVMVDVVSTDRAGRALEDVVMADLTPPDRDAYGHLFRGVDTVVHLAFVGNSDPSVRNDSDQRFANEFMNVQMAYNVFQTALEEGVRRVVMASSNHAADYFEPLILDGLHDFVDPSDRALSDNYYGWAKEAYEHLGFVFATGRQARAHGTGETRALEVVQLRIGGPRETDLENCPLGDLRQMRRALAVYLSERDLQQLVGRSIEADDIRDANGVPFQVFYGISGNTHAFWSIVNARRVVGYAPQDNSEEKFSELIQRHLAAANASSVQ